MPYPYLSASERRRHRHSFSGGASPVDPDAELRALIQSLYGSGEAGAFYIPRPVVLGEQVLFQDSAGTVSVAADGDPVGLMLDVSGNGNDASQATSASRPTYRTNGTLHWLEFDGVDDRLDASGLADLFSGVDSALTCSASLQASGSGGGSQMIISGSSAAFTPIQGVWSDRFGPGGTPAVISRSESSQVSTSFGDNAPYSSVISVITGSGAINARVDGQSRLSGFDISGPGSYSSTIVTIGALNRDTVSVSDFFSGNIRALVVVGDVLSDETLVAVEEFIS